MSAVPARELHELTRELAAANADTSATRKSAPDLEDTTAVTGVNR